MLLENEQKFLSYNAFIDKYSIKTNYVEYHKVISTVAHYKKVHSTAYPDPTPKDPVDTLLSHTKVSKKIYECLINEKASIPSKSQGKWLEERDIHCNLSITVYWENTYYLSSLCTRESKLRAFQFKFLLRKIATNDFLYKNRYQTNRLLLLLRGTKRNPRSSILNLQINSELLEEHVRVDLSKFLSLLVSLFRSY